jgi:hypothetical protein
LITKLTCPDITGIVLCVAANAGKLAPMVKAAVVTIENITAFFMAVAQTVSSRIYASPPFYHIAFN